VTAAQEMAVKVTNPAFWDEKDDSSGIVANSNHHDLVVCAGNLEARRVLSERGLR
jgi:hypothetical protein